MDYWKSKVLPKIKKVFEKNGTKKAAAAAEACKSFDDSKEEINKEFEDKKSDLQPKVIEIYEASSPEIKTLLKEPEEAGLKKNSTAVHKLLEELVKIGFPGSKPVSEACSKFGAALVPGPVFFIFEKVSTFIVTEEKAAEEETKEEIITAEGEEASATATDEKVIVVEEAKKEEPTADKTEPAAEPPAAAAPAEPAAKEDQPPAAETTKNLNIK